MAVKFSDISKALKDTYSAKAISDMLSQPNPLFRRLRNSAPKPDPLPCPSCGGNWDEVGKGLAWHVEVNAGRGWLPSNANKDIQMVTDPEQWLEAAVDYMQKGGCPGAWYRLIYLGREVLETRCEGELTEPLDGQPHQDNASRHLHEWKNRWGIWRLPVPNSDSMGEV